MAFCTNCGHEIISGTKFCANCGAVVEAAEKTGDDVALTEIKTETANIAASTVTETKKDKAKLSWGDKCSMIFGIVLLIISFAALFSDPPILTILLSIAIIVGAIVCLCQNYRLKGFPIAALVIAIYCLAAAVSQGKDLGFFTTPSKADYKSEAVVEKSENSTVDGVNPELKAYLDSYEEFIDEYVVFMKNYMANPGNVVSMLSEYTRIMEKYEDFEDTINKYDSDKMSPADAQYYLEVTARCTQKMLEIYK